MYEIILYIRKVLGVKENDIKKNKNKKDIYRIKLVYMNVNRIINNKIFI